MNVGAENRTQLVAAIGLGIVALILVITRFIGSFTMGSSSAAAPPPAVVINPVAERSAPPPRNLARDRNAARGQNVARALDPSLHLDLLTASEDTKYAGTGRNIFRVFVEPLPKPIVRVVPKQQVASAPPPPPPPPPINLKFYGFATPVGGSKRIFLAQGEDVFIAKEGDIVDRRYKIVRISPNAVEILDVLSNNRQSIPLTQG
ncbi:MAG: hypothetical protein JOZ14_01735 [Acidobacteria bacterium]|nr:hypothetical protein [Acidobacteriota bacterium]